MMSDGYLMSMSCMNTNRKGRIPLPLKMLVSALDRCFKVSFFCNINPSKANQSLEAWFHEFCPLNHACYVSDNVFIFDILLSRFMKSGWFSKNIVYKKGEQAARDIQQQFHIWCAAICCLILVTFLLGFLYFLVIWYYYEYMRTRSWKTADVFFFTRRCQSIDRFSFVLCSGVKTGSF